MEWFILVGFAVGLPLLGGWMYLMRKRDLTSGGWAHESTRDTPTLVEGTGQHGDGSGEGTEAGR